MDKLQLLAMVQAYTGIGIGLMIGLGALGACVGVGIMCSRLEEAAAHDAYADAGAERAEADHEADADSGIGLNHRQQLQFVHLVFPFSKDAVISGVRAPSRCTRRSAS